MNNLILKKVIKYPRNYDHDTEFRFFYKLNEQWVGFVCGENVKGVYGRIRQISNSDLYAKPPISIEVSLVSLLTEESTEVREIAKKIIENQYYDFYLTGPLEDIYENL